MSATITMYEPRLCGYCSAAKRLFDKKGWPVDSIIVDGRAEVWDQMVERTGRSTVPQIYIGDYHVGGFDDLADLDMQGELENLYNNSQDEQGK